MCGSAEIGLSTPSDLFRCRMVLFFSLMCICPSSLPYPALKAVAEPGQEKLEAGAESRSVGGVVARCAVPLDSAWANVLFLRFDLRL